MFTPGRVAITLIALLVAVILYWVTKILSVQTMALVQVNFTNWPTWGQLTFQAFPVLVLIMLFVWAFRQLNPERDLGETEPHPFRMASSAFGLVKSTQFNSTPKFGGKKMKIEPPMEPPSLTFEKSQWGSGPLAGQFTTKSKKKKKGSKDAFDF